MIGGDESHAHSRDYARFEDDRGRLRDLRALPLASQKEPTEEIARDSYAESRR